MDYSNMSPEEILESWDNESDEMEVLDEICLYREDGYSLHIDPTITQNKGFSLSPYVKVYDNESYTKAKYSARIELDDGHVVYHKDGKKNLKVTDDIANKTEDLVNNGVCNNGSYEGQKIIDIINNIMPGLYTDYTHIDSVDLSNYYEGKKKKKK